MIGRGHGKLILCGEHAVVYGYPAIAMAVDRGTTVRLIARPGPTSASDATIDDPRLPRALLTVLPAEGYGVEIRTDLPIGRGMGSSAALAVALVRANAARTGEPLDADTLWDRAMDVERVFHGNPSGLDHALSARGGLARYRRPGPGERPVLEVIPPPRWGIVVLDSGKAGDTAQMVAGVAARRPRIDGNLARIGALVDEARAVMQDTAALGALLDENHAHLQVIGVSTPDLDALVALARRSGAAGAKLAGAGGGGVVLAISDEPEAVLSACLKSGASAFRCAIAP